MTVHVAVVGAGPAGIRATELLHKHGCKVSVIHEGPSGGGQIYRRQPAQFRRKPRALYGTEAVKATRLHDLFDELSKTVTVHSDSTVFGITGKELHVHGPGARVEMVAFDKLVLATGATDRVFPLPGWTLPGVFTLGAAQIALKHQACAIGRRVAFLGTGPLLYLVACQYVKAGAEVAGVFDTSSSADKRRALPRLLADPALLLRGIGFQLFLHSRGVPLREGIVPTEFVGETSVRGLRYRHHGTELQADCDAVGFGYGLKPETQLAELLGIPHRFDPVQRVRTLVHDGNGRAAKDVYVAGDGVAIAGADAAELSGELAAWSVLADLGRARDERRVRWLRRHLARHARFRAGLDLAFPIPVHLLHEVSDATVLCRCEAVTVGALRATATRFETTDVNRLKALSRVGMGRCQARVCGLATTELLAHVTGRSVEEVGFLRGQMPVKPLPLELAASAAEPAVAQTLRDSCSRQATP